MDKAAHAQISPALVLLIAALGAIALFLIIRWVSKGSFKEAAKDTISAVCREFTTDVGRINFLCIVLCFLLLNSPKICMRITGKHCTFQLDYGPASLLTVVMFAGIAFGSLYLVSRFTGAKKAPRKQQVSGQP